jgi:hypothetical protein
METLAFLLFVTMQRNSTGLASVNMEVFNFQLSSKNKSGCGCLVTTAFDQNIIICSNSSWKLSFISSIFILCWGMNIQNNYMKPATFQYYVWCPIPNKLNPINCWYDSLMYKKPCTQFMVLIPLSIDKCVFSCWCGATAPPLNLTYIWTVPLKLQLGSPPCTNSLCSMFQILCPHSVP